MRKRALQCLVTVPRDYSSVAEPHHFDKCQYPAPGKRNEADPMPTSSKISTV
jgi:hypothetical protein